MSRREEIRQKEKLQAQFQLNFSNLNSTVLSWLPSSTSNSNSSAADSKKDQDSFLDLQVIKQGSGLSLASETSSFSSSSSSKSLPTTTIRDFVSSGKIESGKKDGNNRDAMNRISSAKGGFRVDKNSGIGGSGGAPSKALSALRNKLRDGKRGQIQNQNRNNASITSNHRSNQAVKNVGNKDDSDSDSDDEDEVLARKSGSTKNNNVKGKFRKPF